MALFPILLVTHIALAVSLFVPSLVLPFVLRGSRVGDAAGGAGAAGGSRGERDAWPIRVLLTMQGRGAVLIGIGLAVTGVAMLLLLGPSLIGRPWLIVALVIYALNVAVAAFVSRPSLRRLARLPAAGNDAAWRRQARRQRWIAYAMAAATGVIGLLMSTKPDLW